MLAFWWNIGGGLSSWDEVRWSLRRIRWPARICCAVFSFLERKAGLRDAHCHDGAQHVAPLQREREDLKIAFAGEDDGQEAAVGGNVEFANG